MLSANRHALLPFSTNGTTLQEFTENIEMFKVANALKRNKTTESVTIANRNENIEVSSEVRR